MLGWVDPFILVNVTMEIWQTDPWEIASAARETFLRRLLDEWLQ